jgi:hypothetical protein
LDPQPNDTKARKISGRLPAIGNLFNVRPHVLRCADRIASHLTRRLAVMSRIENFVSDASPEAGLFQERPGLKYLMIHNVDTTGANVDPGLLVYHIAEGSRAHCRGRCAAAGGPRRWSSSRRRSLAPGRTLKNRASMQFGPLGS